MAPVQRDARRQPGVGRTKKRRIRMPAPNASASAARRAGGGRPGAGRGTAASPGPCRPMSRPGRTTATTPDDRRQAERAIAGAHEDQRQAERHQGLRHGDHPRHMPADLERAEPDLVQPVDLDHLHRELEEPGGDPDGQRGPDEAPSPGADGSPLRCRPLRPIAGRRGRPGHRTPQGSTKRRRRPVRSRSDGVHARAWGDSLVADRSSIWSARCSWRFVMTQSPLRRLVPAEPARLHGRICRRIISVRTGRPPGCPGGDRGRPHLRRRQHRRTKRGRRRGGLAQAAIGLE